RAKAIAGVKTRNGKKKTVTVVAIGLIKKPFFQPSRRSLARSAKRKKKPVKRVTKMNNERKIIEKCRIIFDLLMCGVLNTINARRPPLGQSCQERKRSPQAGEDSSSVSRWIRSMLFDS